MIPWRKWLFGQHGHSNRFVADHADLVRRLIRRDGLEKAMEIAVGGGDSFGDLEISVLDHFGLRDRAYLIDVGCGSGRLTRRAARFPALRYLGTDVNKHMIEHARTTCGRSDFRFALVDKIVIPEQDGVADFVAFFSVGTHLLNEEFFVYLEEARRVLRPGGRIVLSFLDFKVPGARAYFERMIEDTRVGIQITPLNVFFGPDAVRVWADMLNMTCVDIVDGAEIQIVPSERVTAALGHAVEPASLGHSIAVLEKVQTAT